MRRRVKVAVFLASGVVLALVLGLLAAPRLRARAIEASLPVNPARDAKPLDYVSYAVSHRFKDGNKFAYKRTYRCESSDAETVSLVWEEAEMGHRRARTIRPKSSWLGAIFPSARGRFGVSFEVVAESRSAKGRTYPCTRISAYLGDGDMQRTVTYWLSSEVKLTGYVARSIVYLNGNSEEEQLLGFGNGDVVEWGERP